MESIEAPVDYKLYTKVERVTEHVVKQWVSGIGSEATFQSVSVGWFVTFEGSRESLFLGIEKPSLAKGDEVEITIRKKAHADSIQAPIE